MEEKGIGESGRERELGGSARTSEKGAGTCNRAEKGWGHLWEISTSPGVRPPSLLLQEGMLTKSTWKLQSLAQKRPEKGKWRQHLHLSTRGDVNLAAWAVFVVNSKGIRGKHKVQDWLLPQNRDVPSLCSPPDLLNVCAFHQPPSRRMLQKHPLKSSIVPTVPAGRRELGLQKSPPKMLYAISAKFTPSPAAEQTWLGGSLGSRSIPRNPRVGVYPHPSHPGGFF